MTGATSAPASASRSGPETEPLRWLAERLGAQLGGALRTDVGSRALYASDASSYRVLPAMVAVPRSVEQLAEIAGRCGEAGVALTVRGAGTSLAGNAVGPGVVVDTSRYLDAILELDPEAGTVTVEPGIVLDELNRRAAAHGLRLGPDPSTHSRCTIGGMLGNNACGSHSVRWGTTAGSTLGLEVIRSDGSRLRVGERPAGHERSAAESALEDRLRELAGTNLELLRRELPPWPRRVSGYALDWLLPERGFDVAKALVGTEGTCAVVASATLRLVRAPAAKVLLVLGFADDVEAAAAVPALLPEEPLTVESLPRGLLAGARDTAAAERLPSGDAWLLVETGGATDAEAADHARRLTTALGRTLDDASVELIADGPAQAALWRIREDGSGRASRLADGTPAWPGFEDAAVPPDRLAGYLAAFRTLLAEHGLRGMPYGHFGEGCIHVRLDLGLERPDRVAPFEQFMDEAARLVVDHGGTLSGEHGDGRARSALLGRQFSPELLALFGRFRAACDVTGTLNPGVVVDPRPIDADLRPPRPTLIPVRPELAYAADGGDVRLATLRCIGIGKCVNRSTAVSMCPSYKATRDERDSTRGRARLLQEMLTGSLAGDGWRSTDVRDALDLCLACKACLSDCPTGVDMASYKAEFLSHHYAGRLRPRHHYTLGWLPRWLRLTQPVARLANGALRIRPLARLFALAAGIEPELGIPRLAPRSFLRSFPRSRVPAAPRAPQHGRVVLWPDTFTNYLTPEVGHAAVRVLGAAGFSLDVPRRPVCCGLTWVTTGQLDRARKELRRTLGTAALAGEEPVVVLEPSCAAMLRRDLPELLPDDPRAAALARRVTTLAELLEGVAYEQPGRARVTATLQPHCHQQAVLGGAADRAVLGRCGVEVATEVTGCCGLAGSFGAEPGHAAVSRAVAGLELLPALEGTAPDALVLADGFSCRTQIDRLTGRRARHLAEVLADGLDPVPAGDTPGG